MKEEENHHFFFPFSSSICCLIFAGNPSMLKAHHNNQQTNSQQTSPNSDSIEPAQENMKSYQQQDWNFINRSSNNLFTFINVVGNCFISSNSLNFEYYLFIIYLIVCFDNVMFTLLRISSGELYLCSCHYGFINIDWVSDLLLYLE